MTTVFALAACAALALPQEREPDPGRIRAFKPEVVSSPVRQNPMVTARFNTR